MLVLSRAPGEGIAFPELDLAIEVLKIRADRVQIGIVAAEHIRVLRSELLGRSIENDGCKCPEAAHSVRNRLNAVCLSLSIAQKHLDRGDIKRAELALQRVANRLAEESSSVSEALPMPESKRHLRVLLVEDNPNEGNLLAEILALNHVDVQVVRDGAEVLAVLERAVPHAVLLDMCLPNCDGRTILAQIRSDSRLKAVPIYAVTGTEQASTGIEICAERGVNEWFQKPVQSQAILQALYALKDSTVVC